MASNIWTADRRLYLDKDGKVVEANDPSRATLLIAAGGNMSLADAERYGLIAPAAPAEKARPAPANKAKAPGENK